MEQSTDARAALNSSQKQKTKWNTRFHWTKTVLVTVIRALVSTWVSMRCYCSAIESRKDVHRDLIDIIEEHRFFYFSKFKKT